MEENKKSASPKKNFAYGSLDSIVCIKGVYPYLWILATTDPPRLIALASAVSKLRFRLCLRLHGVVHDMPSPMAGLLHIEIAGVVRRVRRVMRILSALFPRLLLHIRTSQGGVIRDWCYALLDGGARPSLTAFREG